ncbi:MAG: N-acetyl-alpha-D-glucosaminyl L-malate synthase [Chlamydiae bacterium]|nr:N-acetyl-alpha-D-glucosaminyl L-malate synthase [Chlamydiota bacterium]
MKILHTEASPGWGGQEIRILREAEGMRKRGHQVVFAVQERGGLVQPARKAGFLVYEIPFKKSHSLQVFYSLLRIVRKHGIEILNTHSSLDAWIGGLVGKISGCLVVRTRHLSTPIRKGINSRLLYNWLADRVVTTCQEVVPKICAQAKIPESRCISIPTGVDPSKLEVKEEEVARFREDLGVGPEDCLAGTLCILRSWKGIDDLLQAAHLCLSFKNLHWVIVGSSPNEEAFREKSKALGLGDKIHFTGYLSPPYTALAAMDLFVLLSSAHEGVSQASLQAAYLEKPLVTTPTGGLKEVCLDGETGFLVKVHDPDGVAKVVEKLARDEMLRKEMGRKGKELVESKFLLEHTISQMEAIYTH